MRDEREGGLRSPLENVKCCSPVGPLPLWKNLDQGSVYWNLHGTAKWARHRFIFKLPNTFPGPIVHRFPRASLLQFISSFHLDQTHQSEAEVADLW